MAMQTGKNFLHVTVLACGALLTAIPAMAQCAPAQAPADAPAGKAGHAAGKQAKELKEQLNLTPDQMKTVKAALEEEMTKAKATKDDTTLAPKDRHKAMMAAHMDAETKIKAVLTDDQKPKYDAFEAQRRAEMKAKRTGAGAPAADGATPPPPPPGV